MTSKTALWYLTRGSGVVALVLLTAAVLLGVLASLRVRGERWPRFAVGSLHRNLTLLSIVFVALHVVTTVADGYAPIGLKDAIIPFASPYRPLWLGLGAVAFDLLLALVVTSYLRHRIGARAWRGIHWLAYASWPVALLHAFGTGSDARSGFLVAAGALCLVAVALAVVARVAVGGGLPGPRLGGAVAALAVPLALVVWYESGPAKLGWAKRAGTPTHLLASARTTSTGHTVLTSASSTVSPPRSFSSYASGTITQSESADGGVHVVIKLRLAADPHGALRIDLRGLPSEGGGVAMSASGVSFVPATTRATYYGSVTALDGDRVGATVTDAAGDRLDLTIGLSIDRASGTASGIIDAGSSSGGSG